jgi:hypothetical protein
MGTFKLEEKAGPIRRAVHKQLLDNHQQRIIAGDNVEELQAFRVPAASRQLRGRKHRERQLCNASREKPIGERTTCGQLILRQSANSPVATDELLTKLTFRLPKSNLSAKCKIEADVGTLSEWIWVLAIASFWAPLSLWLPQRLPRDWEIPTFGESRSRPRFLTHLGDFFIGIVVGMGIVFHWRVFHGGLLALLLLFLAVGVISLIAERRAKPRLASSVR